LLVRRGAEERLNLLDQRLALERLDQMAVGSSGTGTVLVKRLEVSSQQQHRNVLGRRIRFDCLAYFVAAHSRHHHVRQDQVGLELSCLG
jgi:hypothetical protein